MLVYDNGRVCVLANTRCGHTSMYRYFGLEPYTVNNSISQWYNTASVRVLVLRNPLDRWLSAYSALAQVPPRISREQFMLDHSAPFLQYLAWQSHSWHYIDFYRLREYLPQSHSPVVTHSVCADRSQFADDPVMMRELAAYKLFKRHCKELSVGEWRELTHGSV